VLNKIGKKYMRGRRRSEKDIKKKSGEVNKRVSPHEGKKRRRGVVGERGKLQQI
jgi:hypothetical protein